MENILNGIRIIDFSTYASIPGAGRILADLGADVIKVEAPAGDPMRVFGNTVGVVATDEENPFYEMVNFNKRNICLDMKTAEGKTALFDLLKTSNAFISNLRYDALGRLGISYEDLKDHFPSLVYAHLSGYGLKGPDAGLPGFDTTAYWARGGGLMDLPLKGHGPMGISYGIGDSIAGICLAAGVMGALCKQIRTGEGSLVLTSLFGTAVYSNQMNLMAVQEQYAPDTFPKDLYSVPSPLCTTYVAKDGRGVTLTILNYTRDWPKFCKAISREDWINEPKFSTEAAAKEPANNKELIDYLVKLISSQNADYWAVSLKENDIPFSIAQRFKDVLHDSMAWGNGFLTNATFPNGNKSVVASTPIQIGENVASECRPAHAIGQDTQEILKEIGYTDDQIKIVINSNAKKH